LQLVFPETMSEQRHKPSDASGQCQGRLEPNAPIDQVAANMQYFRNVVKVSTANVNILSPVRNPDISTRGTPAQAAHRRIPSMPGFCLFNIAHGKFQNISANFTLEQISEPPQSSD